MFASSPSAAGCCAASLGLGARLSCRVSPLAPGDYSEARLAGAKTAVSGRPSVVAVRALGWRSWRRAKTGDGRASWGRLRAARSGAHCSAAAECRALAGASPHSKGPLRAAVLHCAGHGGFMAARGQPAARAAHKCKRFASSSSLLPLFTCCHFIIAFQCCWSSSRCHCVRTSKLSLLLLVHWRCIFLIGHPTPTPPIRFQRLIPWPAGLSPSPTQ